MLRGRRRPVRSPARSLRAVALVAGLGLLLGACTADSPRSGVGVRSLATELVYGIPPTPKPAAPANTDPVPDDPKPVEVGDSGDAETVEPDDGPDEGPAPAPPSEECPEAGPTEFPDEPAESGVEGRPEPGKYEWRYDGEQEVPAIGRVPLPRAVPRRIQDVQETDEGFTFTMVEPDLAFGSEDTVFSTYEVRNKVQEDGIYLTRIVREDEDGDSREFNPSPAVEILPLPVVPETEIDSVGVDPNTFQTLRHTGVVKERRRVDACGELVDGWFVDAAQESVDPGDGEQTQRDYDYTVATQMGGMLVFEHVATPCAMNDEGECTNEPEFVFDARLGQVEPDEE